MSAKFQVIMALSLLSLSIKAQTSAVIDAYQHGLYLQHTRGMLPEAIQRFDSALKSGSKTPPKDILLQKTECYDWLGQENDKRQSITALRNQQPELCQRIGSAKDFPAQSDLIMHFELERLGFDQLLRKAAVAYGQPPRNVDLGQIKRKIGFDPRKDIKRITVGLALQNQSFPVAHWVARLEGRFAQCNPKGLLEQIGTLIQTLRNPDCASLKVNSTPKGYRIETACPVAKTSSLIIKKKHTHWTLQLKQNKQLFTLGLVCLDPQTILVGEQHGLLQHLKVLSNKAVGLRGNRRLWQSVVLISPGADFWLLLSPDEILNQVHQLQDSMGLPTYLPDLSGLVVVGALDRDLEIEATAWSADAESARMVADLIRGGLAILRLTTAASKTRKPALSELVDGINIATQQEKIKVSAKVPRALLRLQRSAHSLK